MNDEAAMVEPKAPLVPRLPLHTLDLAEDLNQNRNGAARAAMPGAAAKLAKEDAPTNTTPSKVLRSGKRIPPSTTKKARPPTHLGTATKGRPLAAEGVPKPTPAEAEPGAISFAACALIDGSPAALTPAAMAVRGLTWGVEAEKVGAEDPHACGVSPAMKLRDVSPIMGLVDIPMNPDQDQVVAEAAETEQLADLLKEIKLAKLTGIQSTPNPKLPEGKTPTNTPAAPGKDEAWAGASPEGPASGTLDLQFVHIRVGSPANDTTPVWQQAPSNTPATACKSAAILAKGSVLGGSCNLNQLLSGFEASLKGVDDKSTGSHESSLKGGIQGATEGEGPAADRTADMTIPHAGSLVSTPKAGTGDSPEGSSASVASSAHSGVTSFPIMDPLEMSPLKATPEVTSKLAAIPTSSVIEGPTSPLANYVISQLAATPTSSMIVEAPSPAGDRVSEADSSLRTLALEPISAAHASHTPGEGAAAKASYTPGEGTTAKPSDTPGEGTAAKASLTPGEGTPANASHTPGDGTAPAAESTPGGVLALAAEVSSGGASAAHGEMTPVVVASVTPEGYIPREKVTPFMERHLRTLQATEWTSADKKLQVHKSQLEVARDKAIAAKKLESATGLSTSEKAITHRLVKTAIQKAVQSDGRTLGETLVKHRSRLEIAKASASARTPIHEKEPKQRRPSSGFGGRGLGDVMLVHKSRLQKEKEAAAAKRAAGGGQADKPLPSYMRATASFKAATGGLSDLKVHKSKLELEKEAASARDPKDKTLSARGFTSAASRAASSWTGGGLSDLKVHKSKLERDREAWVQKGKNPVLSHPIVAEKTVRERAPPPKAPTPPQAPHTPAATRTAAPGDGLPSYAKPTAAFVTRTAQPASPDTLSGFFYVPN